MKFGTLGDESILRIDEATVSHGRILDPFYYDTGVRGAANSVLGFADGYQLSSKDRDIITARQTGHLDEYDREADVKVLESLDIVAAYNALIEGDIKKCESELSSGTIAGTVGQKVQNGRIVRDVETGNAETSYGIANQMSYLRRYLNKINEIAVSLNMSADDVREKIVDAFYNPSDDPDEIKAIVEARIAYNDTIIGLYQMMLSQNYAMLGITQQEAEVLIAQLGSTDSSARKTAIQRIKRALVMNEDKFRVVGFSYDLRPLGGGIILLDKYGIGDMQKDQTGSIDYMIQDSLQYDVVIYTHGGSNDVYDINRESRGIYGTYSRHATLEKRKLGFQLDDEYDKINREFDERLSKVATETERLEVEKEKAAAIDAKKREYASRINAVTKMYNDKRIAATDKLYANRDSFVVRNKNLKKGKGVWTIDPIVGLNGKTYIEMDPLIRDLIRAGFKSFIIYSCNPGHHHLAMDILKTPGVTIRYNTTNTIIETTCIDESDEWAVIENTLYDAEVSLLEAANRNGIDYLGHITDDLDVFMTEGVLSNIWRALVTLVKKAISTIISIFKGIINFFKKIINAIKSLFRKATDKSTKLPNKIKTNSIVLEDASIKTVEVSSFADVQYHVLKACDSISKKIKETQQRQISNMEELKRYSEDKVKTIQENTNPRMDAWLSTVLG